jgi:hypothetical protein
MTATFSSRVLYANSQPKANVRVRLFDKDVGSGDDDLTIQEGLSDAQGRFTVIFSAQKKLNFADIYLPYLQFNYTINGLPHTHKAFVQPFFSAYRLPEIPAIDFVPSQHGFQFVNRYPGFWIPYSIPAVPDIPSAENSYGLCGGMVAAAYDFLLAGRPIPIRRRRPGRASPLHQYIHRRQVDSLGVFGRQIVRFARWMALSDQAVELRTRHEFDILRQNLDCGHPIPIGLVYVGAKETLEIWKNHQVLAVGYQQNGDHVAVQLYDPNYPRTNDVHLACRIVDGNRLTSKQVISPMRSQHVRAWFVMEYKPVTPSAELDVDS